MAEPIISLSGVSVKYILTNERPKTLQEYLIRLASGRISGKRDFWALREIDASVQRGESFGIIGVNGSGKSTLLKVIAGILKPSEGEVSVSGKIAPLIELGAGFDTELTGAENIYLNASILGLTRKQIDARYRRIVEFSEIENFIHSPLKSYSSGMVARLGFSIAVEVDAEILAVDEVLSVGDEGFKKKCHNRIDAIMNGGVTLLFVSHNLGEVQRLCRRVIWLENGKMRASGDADLMVRRYLMQFEKNVFEDIREGHPYKEYIDALFLNGVVTGYSVGGKRYYNPDDKVRRAGFALFLGKALGIKKPLPSGRIFDDVSEANWASGHINWLFEQGLVDGIKGDKGGLFFFPDDDLSTDEAKKILSRIDSERAEQIRFGNDHVMTRGEIARVLCEFFQYERKGSEAVLKIESAGGDR